MVIEWTDSDKVALNLLNEKKKKYEERVDRLNVSAVLRLIADKIETEEITDYDYNTKSIFAIHSPGELKYPPRVGEEISLTVKVYG